MNPEARESGWLSGTRFLILAAFILGIVLRFYQLGAEPLADSGAVWSNQAILVSESLGPNTGSSITSQPSPISGPNTAYILLTGVLFTIFGESNFTARFLPALAGSLLILVPMFFLKKTKNTLFHLALVILALGLAVDPGLVTASRQIGSPVMAVSFGILAIAAWYRSAYLNPGTSISFPIVLAGFLAGVALLSGPAIFNLILSIGLTVLLFTIRITSANSRKDPGESLSGETPQPRALIKNRGGYFLTALITFLSIGTLLGQFSQGLGLWLESIQNYLVGWVQAGGNLQPTPLKMIIALLVYGLMPVSFFLIGLGRGLFSSIKDPSNLADSEPEQFPGTSPEEDFEAIHQAPSDQPAETTTSDDGLSRNRWLFLVTWTGFSLLLTLAYPGRQVADLTLTMLLIWSIAASEMAVDLFPYRDQEEREHLNLPVAIILASFILILMALFWFTLSALSRYTPSMGVDPSSLAGSLRWIVPMGTLILIALTSILVCLGWSFRTGGKGFFWGITTALLIYTIAVLWGSAYLRPNQPEEFWSLTPGTGNAHLMRQTLDTISLKETGFKGFLDIAVLVDSPSLRWELRDYSQTTFVKTQGSSTNQALDLSFGTNLAGEQPAIVITSLDQELPALSAAYSGQDFVWWTWQGWEGDIPPDFIRWLNYREAPINNAKIILWVRADIIRDEELTPSEEFSPDEGFVPFDEIPLSGES